MIELRGAGNLTKACLLYVCLRVHLYSTITRIVIHMHMLCTQAELQGGYNVEGQLVCMSPGCRDAMLIYCCRLVHPRMLQTSNHNTQIHNLHVTDSTILVGPIARAAPRYSQRPPGAQLLSQAQMPLGCLPDASLVPPGYLLP